MTGFTEYFVDKVMGHCLAGVSWTPPSSVYVQLHTGDPGPDGTANVAATSTRKLVTWAGSAIGGQLSANDLSWVTTAKEAFTHISYWDAETSGHCLATDVLEEAKNLYLGDTFDLPTATLQIPPGA